MKLTSALALLIAFIVIPKVEGASFDGNLTARSAWEKQQNGGLLIIDMRRPGEWRATGVPRGAIMLSLENHPSGFEGFLHDLEALLHEDMQRPFVLICRTGGRTSRLLPHLQKLGFKNAMHVSGGIFGNPSSIGWVGENLPMSPEGLTLSDLSKK